MAHSAADPAAPPRRTSGIEEVWALEADLPHPSQGSIDPRPRERARRPIQQAAAVRQVQDEDAAGAEHAAARPSRCERIGQVLEDVVEDDDVVALIGADVRWKHAGPDVEASLQRTSGHVLIGLESNGASAPLRCQLEEPAIAASDLQEVCAGETPPLAERVEDPLEVVATQALERPGAPFGQVHRLGPPRGRRECRCPESALIAAREPGGEARRERSLASRTPGQAPAQAWISCAGSLHQALTE